MSTIKKNDFERIEGRGIIRIKNRIQAKKRDKIKFQTQISKGMRKAKLSKMGEGE